MTTDLKQREELKRDRQWNPLARWRALQGTLTWAEAQHTVRRNTPADRLKEQARKMIPREHGT